MRVLSWNTLSTFLKCPLMFKYQADRVEFPKDSRNAILGITIQRLFELWINEGHFWDGSTWLYQNFDRVWNECQSEGSSTGGWGAHCPWASREQELRVMSDAREQVGNLFAMFAEHHLLAKVMASEAKFDAKLPTGDLIRGSIDFMLEKPGGKFILDAKGTRYKTRYLDKRQLAFYKLGMVLSKGDAWRDAEAAWLIYRNKLYETVPIGDPDLEEMTELCIKTYEGIRAAKFEATPGDSCRFCDWKGSCSVINTDRVNDGLFEV